MAGKLSDIDRQPLMMRRTTAGLTPAAGFDAERLDQYAIGAEVEVRVHQRRSSPHNRLYWSMLAKVVENTDEYPTAEKLHTALKNHLGYVEVERGLDGKPFTVPDSTAFASMDQAAFRLFFDQAVAAIAEFILPGVDPVALVNEGASHG